MATKTVDKRHSGVGVVDPRDEPSSEWGWHGRLPKATRIGGWVVAFAMFMMLIGNHEGNIENIWLVALGLGIVGLLLWDIRKSRTAWRR